MEVEEMRRPTKIAGEIWHETQYAIQFYGGVKNECWLPRSQICIEGANDDCTVTMPEWLAKENDLI